MSEARADEAIAPLPNECGRCKHGKFFGISPIGTCDFTYKLPMCIQRFLPRVSTCCIRAVDYRDGGGCQTFEVM